MLKINNAVSPSILLYSNTYLIAYSNTAILNAVMQ